MSMNSSRLNKLILLIALALLLTACGKKGSLPENVLAEVNGTNITLDDFKRAYLPVLLYSDKRETMQTREEVLNILINQTLLAQAARGLELDTIQTLDVLRRTAQKSAFTRILYQDWVKDNLPEPGESDLRQAFRQSHTSLLVKHLFFDDLEAAQQAASQLDAGASWDSLAAATFREASLAANGGVLGWIRFGDMDPDFEQAAYGLSPGERSPPVKTKFGWHIIEVEDQQRELMLTEYDFSLERSKLRRLIRERHQQRLADSVISELMGKANLVFQPDIAPRVWAIMQSQLRAFLNNGELEQDLSPELGSFAEKLEPILDEEMLRFADVRWTVKDFLERLPEMNRQLMLSDLKKATGFLVRDEILYHEGLRQGLHELPEVQGEIRDRENQFLANLYLRYQADTRPISSAAVEEFYREHAAVRYQSSDSLYVYELLFESLQDAEQFKLDQPGQVSIQQLQQLTLMDKGVILKDLGWFMGARADRPEYYHKLVNVPINTLQGPLSQHGGIALILASRRHRHTLPLDQIRDLVREDAAEDRNMKLRITEVKRLSEDAQIQIERSLLEDLTL